MLNQSSKKVQSLNPEDYKSHSYSQLGEDLCILQLLKHNKHGREILDCGFYVDVGAFHPFEYSNTFLFYQRGWTGINIEPNTDNFLLFEEYRPLDINLNVGISSSRATLDYYMFSHGAFNTFSKEKADIYNSKKNVKLLDTKKVKTIPLQDIFEKHVTENRKVNILNVDVEGLDLEVLQSLDFSTYRPMVVIVEESGKNLVDLENRSENYAFLVSKNYTLIRTCTISLIFIANEYI